MVSQFVKDKQLRLSTEQLMLLLDKHCFKLIRNYFFSSKDRLKQLHEVL